MVNQIIHFDSEDVASQALIPSMMHDTGIQGEELRAATDQFARTRIDEADGELSMGDLQTESACFAWGYEQCLVNHGLLEADDIRTFPPKR